MSNPDNMTKVTPRHILFKRMLEEKERQSQSKSSYEQMRKNWLKTLNKKS